jgi:PPK2 family polyphosphate:nucleotide phosphotransferase
MKLRPVDSKRTLRLSDADAVVEDLDVSKEDIESQTEDAVEKISKLQRILYADGQHALLIVLQGRDASGKDGTIRKVFTAVNPQGCSVSSFKVPTEEERAHDFLWRIHRQVPARGMIGIFNRSHYEDILVPRVKKLVPKKVWSARYDQINEFERMLSLNGVTILKFMLHISREEQRKRFQERVDDDEKNWKFRLGDLEDRQHWDDFTRAYRDILEETSTKWAPWYMVPGDDKKVRNWLISRTIASTLNDLDLKYPDADPEIAGLEIE